MPKKILSVFLSLIVVIFLSASPVYAESCSIDGDPTELVKGRRYTLRATGVESKSLYYLVFNNIAVHINARSNNVNTINTTFELLTSYPIPEGEYSLSIQKNGQGDYLCRNFKTVKVLNTAPAKPGYSFEEFNKSCIPCDGVANACRFDSLEACQNYKKDYETPKPGSYNFDEFSQVCVPCTLGGNKCNFESLQACEEYKKDNKTATYKCPIALIEQCKKDNKICQSGQCVPVIYAAGKDCDGNKGVETAIGCIHTDPAGLVRDILKFSVGIGGGIAFLLMLIGAFQMITSAGDPEALKAGQERFRDAIIGLLFIIFSVFLMKILGVDILGLEAFLGYTR